MNPETVKEARTKLGLTHEGFAKALGVSRRTVMRWETGESAPRPGDALLIGWLVGKQIRKERKEND